MKQRSANDRYGRYQLIAHDNFIEGKIVGAIGDGITTKFCNDIKELATQFAGKPFCYLADLSESEGCTEGALTQVIGAYKLLPEMGCVIDALVIKSPLVKRQMQIVSDAADITLPLEVRLFIDRTSAIAFIHKALNKMT